MALQKARLNQKEKEFIALRSEYTCHVLNSWGITLNNCEDIILDLETNFYKFSKSVFIVKDNNEINLLTDDTSRCMIKLSKSVEQLGRAINCETDIKLICNNDLVCATVILASNGHYSFGILQLPLQLNRIDYESNTR